jgi:hypothetical protein
MRTFLNISLALTMCCALLSACSTAPRQTDTPARIGLKLAPATLGETLSLQQHLTVEREGSTNELDTALEIDLHQLNLVGLAFGQRVMTLHYDGKELTTWRHVMLPAEVKGEDVLEDIQLTLWPADAIRAVLPQGWTLQHTDERRTLLLDGQPVMTIDYPDHTTWGGTVVLTNLRYHYRLTIQSIASVAPPQ